MALVALGAGACSPLVRYGDIEPPAGRRTLVDVRIDPDDRASPPPDAFGAAGHQAWRDVLLQPAAKVPASTVASEMAASVQSVDSSATYAAVDMAELATDARRVESMYAARGYFRAHTTRWTVVPRPNRTARLELRVVEGPATRISHIVFAGITPSGSDPEMDARLKAIERELPDLILFARGDIWDEALYLRSRDLVQRLFRERGFIHATVTGDNWVSRDEHRAAVWFNIEHGPLVRADGEPVIIGQHIIPRRRIQQRVSIEDGEILESRLLRETEQQVYELGPFLSVQVRPVRTQAVPAADVPIPEPDAPLLPATPVEPEDGGVLETQPPEILPARVPVEVQVQEASPWDLTIGPAALTDSTKLELSLPVSFTHRNLFGQVVALRVNVKPALVFPDFWVGQDCCSTGNWGLLGKLALEVPSFFEEFLRFNIQASYERDVSQETKKDSLSGRAGFSRRLGASFTASLGYDVSLVSYDGSALGNVTEDLARDLADFRFKERDFVAWLGSALVFDTRDGIYDARRGAYGALSVDYGDGWTGSDIQFLRASLEVRGYLTFEAIPWFTIGLRGKVGGLWFPHGQGTPESVRFKAGGPTSNRGFSANHLGDFICGDNSAHAHDPAAALNDPECGQAATDRVYIGGNYLFESNLELRFQPGTLGFVAFVDAGRLWSRWQDVDAGELFVTVGPGLRIATAVGPIRFDLDYLLGRLRDRVFQFSLGQAF